jgi:antitoxin ParD1/3/4
LPIIANLDKMLQRSAMPTRNINLTPEMDQFIASRIANGDYANASEIVRAGLRALEKDEREDAAKIEALKEAIRAGEASGLAKGDVIDRLRARIRRRAEATGVFQG